FWRNVLKRPRPEADIEGAEIPQCSGLLAHSVCYRLGWRHRLVGSAHLDSEQFRSAPRTCRPFCARLNMRSVSVAHPRAGSPMLGVRRREFITLRGGAAAWPRTARAQQPAKLATIGFLGAGTPSAFSPWTAVFVQRLRELGWIEGRNIAIEYRWAEGRPERYAEIAAEFVQVKVDVIVTTGAAAPAAKQTTSVIPIVFAVANDPIGSGLVAGLARPGGNVTGLSVQARDLAGKRLEFFREVVTDL